MSPPASLRTICLVKTCGLLISGEWEEREDNPFSFMPVSVVQDLLSCMWRTESALSRASIAQSHLLLTSGRIEQVELFCSKNEEDYIMLFEILSRGCQNLRRLSVREVGYGMRRKRNIRVELALHTLLQNCTKLEHLHSCIYFRLIVLGNCRTLKTLRLHFGDEETQMFYRRIDWDHPKRFRCIEVFALCRFPWGLRQDEETSLACTILDECPHITSLGCLNSSVALKDLHDRDLRMVGTPRRFQMRRCYWKDRTMVVSRSKYCERIRVAALSCPLMEVLVIEVAYSGCLQHLKAQSNLTSLVIDFGVCKNDFVHEFYSLLDAIGPQLRHLTVAAFLEKPLNVYDICRKCPKLTILRLNCGTTADEDVQPCANLLSLEHLSLLVSDRKSICFLLSNSLHLKELCLCSCMELGDGALQAILRKNPLAELEVLLIGKCSLSDSGWRSVFKSAVNLRSYRFGYSTLTEDTAMRWVRGLNPIVVGYPKLNPFKHVGSTFPLNLDNYCWL